MEATCSSETLIDSNGLQDLISHIHNQRCENLKSYQVTVHATSACIPLPFPHDVGRQIKEAEDHNEEFTKIFLESMRISKCFTMYGSEMEDKPLVRFASIDMKDGHSRKFRISNIASTFTVEALVVGETLEIAEKIDSEQNFMIFSDSAIVLKGISNSLQ
jgi:hypothetical protein